MVLVGPVVFGDLVHRKADGHKLFVNGALSSFFRSSLFCWRPLCDSCRDCWDINKRASKCHPV